MPALRSTPRLFVLFSVAVFGVSSIAAQPGSQPERVYLPVGKVKVVRVTSVGHFLKSTVADLEMKPGDLIFALDGERIDSAERFSEAFASKTTQHSVTIDFLRAGVVHQLVGPLFRFDRGVFKSDKPRWGGGLETADADFPATLLQKPVVHSVMGLKLSTVKANSAASNAGLQKNDMLLTVNGRSIGRVGMGDVIIPLFPLGTPLTFVYLRDGETLTGSAPLTIVKSGLAKTLSFGFYGESHMVELESKDLPEEYKEGATVEMPAS